MKKETIKQYPIVRYLCLLLVVALLFAGVTFSRYQSRFTSENSVGVAEFDASYTIDSISTTSFGNAYYWQVYNGFWMDQGNGTASTVRITMRNNSAIDVRPTLRLEGPAEFWENIALELTDTVTLDGGNVAAGASLTPQIVIADLVKGRSLNITTDDENEMDGSHRFLYSDDYKSWGENEAFATAKVVTTDSGGVITDVSGFDDFGQRGTLETTLTMNGGLSAADGRVSGAVTAEWTDADGGAWKMIVTASTKEVDFSLGFARNVQGSQSSLPALYLDCRATVPYYTIEIEMPPLAAKSSEAIVAFLTWTNLISANAFGVRFPTGEGGGENLNVPAGFWRNLVSEDPVKEHLSIKTSETSFTVLGYHFNYTDVPYSTSAGGDIAGDTTVRLTRNFANGISYQHIARLNENDAVFPHDIDPENGYYRCSGDNPAYFAENTINKLSTDFNPSTLTIRQSEVEGEPAYVGASEKGYSTNITMSFTQASVLPAPSVTQ